jgi:RNase P subunit RPR2
MDVTILGKVKSIDITSVVISTPRKGDLRLFFCYNCQNPLFQYMGKVITITRGSTPYHPPIIMMCNRCKTVYQIADIE